MTDDRQQRRLATILAADVFGYSRLMAEDEEDALRTLKAHRSVVDRLIARHDGRIFNTAGDSVLAEFGSAVEAVRCAISIQEELRVRNAQIDENRRMVFRIGINVGDVLVDGTNLYGDGVNVAARLEGIAEPGNICISGSVFALVKNKLTYGFEDIGPQMVKNIPEPVPAFRLTSGSGAPQASGVAPPRLPRPPGPSPPAATPCRSRPRWPRWRSRVPQSSIGPIAAASAMRAPRPSRRRPVPPPRPRHRSSPTPRCWRVCAPMSACRCTASPPSPASPS